MTDTPATDAPGAAPHAAHSTTTSRRAVLAAGATAGLGALLGARAVKAQGEAPSLAEAIPAAERLAGLQFTPAERELMATAVKDHAANLEKLRTIQLPNDVPPALRFSPLLPGRKVPGRERALRPSRAHARTLSISPDDLPFHSLVDLGALLRARRVTSTELTQLSLDRLKRLDPQLSCVITLTEERALAQAAGADHELQAGRVRSPLHGIPWGVKDLFSVKGYRTTWGARPFENQVIDEDAAVVERLDAAGAVLVAKLAVGALAWGDVWFGGTTKNPWKQDEGSSGSSAGSAAAVVSGCVGFAIGTETLGSIVSPSHVCGATGLRPTFGRVSRHGAMALSWSMDKVGPLCRHVEDCALVLDAIRGSDGRDADVIDAPFPWDARTDLRSLRLGFDREAFEREAEKDDEEERGLERSGLATLRAQGVELLEVRLPDLPAEDMLIVLEVEAAAAFDELTRSNRDDLLERQIEQAWPNVFRAARLLPAVEYVQAQRARTLLMREMEAAVAHVDAFVHPTWSGKALRVANLTGHPAVCVRNGFRANGTPSSLTFTGRLFGEAELLAAAKAFQDATGWHLRRPPLA